MQRGATVLTVVASLAMVSCGQPRPQAGTTADELRAYLAAVEPIRLGVNQLLNDADPVLDAYRAHTLTGEEASAEMGSLEDTFAMYTVEVNALRPSNPALASIAAPYAHTFILEDSYLNALVNGLLEGDFDSLPDTQNDQRAAIIEWRVQLEILAQRLHVSLPTDLQQAGRGEIAPAISGS